MKNSCLCSQWLKRNVRFVLTWTASVVLSLYISILFTEWGRWFFKQKKTGECISRIYNTLYIHTACELKWGKGQIDFLIFGPFSNFWLFVFTIYKSSICGQKVLNLKRGCGSGSRYKWENTTQFQGVSAVMKNIIPREWWRITVREAGAVHELQEQIQSCFPYVHSNLSPMRTVVTKFQCNKFCYSCFWSGLFQAYKCCLFFTIVPLNC